jgi:RNA polymerase sigma-70 factor (ECF subfamily)
MPTDHRRRLAASERDLLTDRALLARYRQGDCSAAEQIYERYAARLRALTRRRSSTLLARQVDADDIVQSVFHTFFQGARNGDYDVAPGGDLWKLLLVIAMNTIRTRATFHRAARRDVRRTRPIDNLDPTRLASGNPLGDARRTLQRLAAEEALSRLPPFQRRIVELRVEGYQVVEIARATGRSLRTVERTLQQCRRRLADVL